MPRQSNEVKFVDAGVDWITVTARDEDKIDKLRSLAYSLIETQLGVGFFGRPWFQSGYQGVVCGHVQFGERDDGCILRLGSHLANDYWMRVVPLADNVTRLDLQVTYSTNVKPSNVVHKHYRQIQSHRRQFKKAPKLSRIVDADGGYTMYSGRRSSDVMGRIYDKESESKQPRYKGCVRYEVQFTGARARLISAIALSSAYDSNAVAKAVFEFFASRGAKMRFLLDLLSWSRSIDISRGRTEVTDISKKLEWLLKAVRPSVKLLVDKGLKANVLTILGLNGLCSEDLVSTA